MNWKRPSSNCWPKRNPASLKHDCSSKQPDWFPRPTWGPPRRRSAPAVWEWRDNMRTTSRIALAACVLFFDGTAGSSAAQDKKYAIPLVVGWHVDMDSPNWQPLPKPRTPDVSGRHKGFLKMSLGAS